MQWYSFRKLSRTRIIADFETGENSCVIFSTCQCLGPYPGDVVFKLVDFAGKRRLSGVHTLYGDIGPTTIPERGDIR